MFRGAKVPKKDSLMEAESGGSIHSEPQRVAILLPLADCVVMPTVRVGLRETASEAQSRL